MTKETKIGLLVGLGFIIVIGILLSDHIQSSTEPPQARLENAATTVRKAVETPGAGAVEVASAAPATPIPTDEELRNAPVAQSVIKVGGPSSATPADDSSKIVVTPVRDTSPALAAPDGPLVDQTPLPAGNGNAVGGADNSGAVADARQSQDGASVPVGPSGSVLPASLTTGNGTQGVNGAPAVKVVMKSYVAVKGDSLSKIAAKFYGDKSPAMIKLIVDANKDLKANPKNLMAGKTYLIPPGPKGTAPLTVAARTGPTTAPSNTAVATAGTAGRNVATVLYTVKDGDSLWKIATQEVGSGGAVQQIRDLNKDVLKGGDTLKANMKLKLPAKGGSNSAVATVN